MRSDFSMRKPLLFPAFFSAEGVRRTFLWHNGRIRHVVELLGERREQAMVKQGSDDVGARGLRRHDLALVVEFQRQLILGVILFEPGHEVLVLVMRFLVNRAHSPQMDFVGADKLHERIQAAEERFEGGLLLQSLEVLHMSLFVTENGLEIALMQDEDLIADNKEID